MSKYVVTGQREYNEKIGTVFNGLEQFLWWAEARGHGSHDIYPDGWYVTVKSAKKTR